MLPKVCLYAYECIYMYVFFYVHLTAYCLRYYLVSLILLLSFCLVGIFMLYSSYNKSQSRAHNFVTIVTWNIAHRTPNTHTLTTKTIYKITPNIRWILPFILHIYNIGIHWFVIYLLKRFVWANIFTDRTSIDLRQNFPLCYFS